MGTEKSAENPMVVPKALLTVTVHEINSPIRIIDDDELVCPMQLNVDDVEAMPPRTANENELPIMGVPETNFSVITNFEVRTVGAVRTKLNEIPPFVVRSATAPLPLGP